MEPFSPEFAEERRMVVPYQRMPQRLVQAFVAAEDKSFFDHDGVDLKGIVRAALVNLKAGRTVQGASTITQQLAKQLLVRHQGYSKGRMRTLARKYGSDLGSASGIRPHQRGYSLSLSERNLSGSRRLRGSSRFPSLLFKECRKPKFGRNDIISGLTARSQPFFAPQKS